MTGLGLSHDASDDDAYAEGDPSLGDIDAEGLARLMVLADRFDEVQAEPEGAARNMAALELWRELYGDDLVVL